MAEDSVVIINAARTPMGGLNGSLGSVPAPELGAIATSAALQRAGINPADIDELLFGCVLPAGLGQAPARQVAMKANLPDSTQCTTINKVCGSGMKAVLLAHDQILCGTSNAAVAGGMESMTLAPYFIAGARTGLRAGHKQLIDHLFFDALEDAFTGASMGSFAQAIADKNNISREQMDEFAIESLRRAQTAIEQGHFETEIAAVTVDTRQGKKIIAVDEQPLMAKIEKIASLKPAFSKEGTITAANSSSISDGAAALVLCSSSYAKAHGLQPMARIVAHSSNAMEAENFPVAPVGSLQKLLHKADWQVSEVDLFEINEAFAIVPMLAMSSLGIDRGKLNIHGGACALGHPVGASGARIIVTLMHALQRLGGKKGIASICIGGGEATSIAIEMC